MSSICVPLIHSVETLVISIKYHGASKIHILFRNLAFAIDIKAANAQTKPVKSTQKCKGRTFFYECLHQV